MKKNTGKLTLYGAQWCPDCKRSKAYLDERKIDYDYVDLEVVPEAAGIVEKINKGMQSIPTIVFPNGKVLVEPTDEELAAEIGQ
jgi:glutaredoxin